MGISLSKFRRHRHHRRHNRHQAQPQERLQQPIAAASSSSLETPPLQPTPPPCLPSTSQPTPSPCLPSPSPSTPSASLPPPSPPTPPSLPPPSPPTPPPFLPSPSSTPPPPRPSSQPSFVFAANAPFPSTTQGPYAGLPSPSAPAQLSSNYGSPMTMDGFGFSQFPANFNRGYSGWGGYVPTPPPPLPPSPSPPPYVDHMSARKIKNDVNVHKDTIRVDWDEKNLDSHLVSFTFDALVDGSITIFYFAKEGNNCSFTPLYPEIYMPIRIPFQNGLGQKFCQRSGTGIDLGFFALDDLSRPSQNEEVFPLVIYAESSLPSLPPMHEQLGQPPPIAPSRAQITQAVLEKNNEGHFQVKVIKQILWVDGVRYELRELYGIENSDERGIGNNDTGKECVICMTEPNDTVVLPCRHVCLCSECAKQLRLQSNKCPVCRHPIQELIVIVHKEQS